jgi:hypothetical protein
MKKFLIPIREFLVLILGELIISALTVLVFFLLKKFEIAVVLGALLGSLVTVVNFIVLSLTAGRAFDKAREARGTREMTEEEIEKFAAEQKAEIAAATKLAYVIRTLLTVATLVVAFISGIFNVISTVIPLLAFKPILMIDAMIKDKKERS